MGTTTAARKIVVVPDAMPDVAGAMVWWELSGECREETAVAEWKADGHPDNLGPFAPGVVVALKRAAKSLEERHVFARQLASGWAIFREVGGAKDAEDLQPTPVCTAKIDDQDVVAITPDGAPESLRLRSALEHHTGLMTSTDASLWIASKLVPAVQAIALRDRGGFYFVPRTHLDQWRAFVATIRKMAPHTFREIPALQSESAVEAILDAVLREAADEAEGMEKKIVDGDIGTRAIRTCRTRVERAAGKVKAYEDLLGKAMPEIQDRLGRLDASLAAAALATTAEG